MIVQIIACLNEDSINSWKLIQNVLYTNAKKYKGTRKIFYRQLTDTFTNKVRERNLTEEYSNEFKARLIEVLGAQEEKEFQDKVAARNAADEIMTQAFNQPETAAVAVAAVAAPAVAVAAVAAPAVAVAAEAQRQAEAEAAAAAKRQTEGDRSDLLADLRTNRVSQLKKLVLLVLEKHLLEIIRGV